MKNRFKLTAEIFFLGLILLPISSVVSSEIYKWKDKDGKIHYSDTLPAPEIDVEVKKFEEPQSREKPKPKTSLPGPKLDALPPPRAETATKKPQTEATSNGNPTVQRNFPKSKTEASNEKRPYESINVIMYMTAW